MAMSFIDKINNSDNYECVEDFLCENIFTYEDTGAAITELLTFFADSRHDDQAWEMLKSWVEDYIDQTV